AEAKLNEIVDGESHEGERNLDRQTEVFGQQLQRGIAEEPYAGPGARQASLDIAKINKKQMSQLAGLNINRRKGIIQGRRVGDGRSIRISHDPWLPRPYTYKVRSTHSDMPLIVEDLIDSEMGLGRLLWCGHVLMRRRKKLSLGLPVSVAGCMDRIIWHYSSTGVYTLWRCRPMGSLGGKGGGCSQRDDVGYGDYCREGL
ncbi:hypothetical protein DVH24_010702, partial [Malus domestica]